MERATVAGRVPRQITFWRPSWMTEAPAPVMGKLHGKDASVWLVATHPHTYEGKKIDEGDFYLVHEEMVETIVTVLKWARRDTPPKRPLRTATTLQVHA